MIVPCVALFNCIITMSKLKSIKKCRVKYCRRPARKHSSLCTTCDKKLWRKKYPMKAAFQTLRQNSRRRGKVFMLTFEEFKKFCYKTNYIAGKGRSKESYSIDRVKNDNGYLLSNIRVLTVSENSRKGKKVLMYDWRTKYARVI